jgi:hypothetical protein
MKFCFLNVVNLCQLDMLCGRVWKLKKDLRIYPLWVFWEHLWEVRYNNGWDLANQNENWTDFDIEHINVSMMDLIKKISFENQT